eukprot:RCo018406
MRGLVRWMVLVVPFVALWLLAGGPLGWLGVAEGPAPPPASPSQRRAGVLPLEDRQPSPPRTHEERSLDSQPICDPSELSVHLGISARLCYHNQSCTGSLLLRRTDLRGCGGEGGARKFSLSSRTEQVVLQQFGYDSFDVRLSGPEVVMADVHPTEEGPCTYTAGFTLLSEGSYSLSAVWLYTNADAFNDRGRGWHPVLNISLIRSTAGNPFRCVRDSNVLPVLRRPCQRLTCANQPGRWVLSPQLPSPYLWTMNDCWCPSEV